MDRALKRRLLWGLAATRRSAGTAPTKSGGGSRIYQRECPASENPDIGRAMALAHDREAFTDLLFEGQADTGAAARPRPPKGSGACRRR